MNVLQDPQIQRQPQSMQSAIDRTIEQSLQQSSAREPSPQVVQPAQPRQGNVAVQLQTPQAVNAQSVESGVVRVPPMPRVQSTVVNAQCPFCTMRFDVRSDVFYLHVALVHIPRLVNDAQQSKVPCAINSCGNTYITREREQFQTTMHARDLSFSDFEYADRVEQLQGCVCISQLHRCCSELLTITDLVD